MSSNNPLSRRNFLKGGKTSRPELERLNPNWPTKRVAKLIRNKLEKTPPVYHPPKVEELPPILPITHSTESLQNVDWDMGAARHLLCRTMFGPKYPEIKEASENLMEIELSSILSTVSLPDPPGEWVNEPAPQWDALTMEEIQELIDQYREWMWDLRYWWMKGMMRNPINIQEMITLFWHNYFATAQSKVFYPQAMYQQNSILREYGLGNFKELLRQVTFGSAMMIWLDIHQSKDVEPNENFPRELLELFTMGVDNYSQDDIVEAARAFTGYRTNGVETNYSFEEAAGSGWWWDEWHDFEEKTFLGQTGNWNGDDIINIIMEQDATAVHICTRLYKWFVYQNVDETVVNEMANILRNNDYNIASVLYFLFSTEHFYDVNFRGADIQNPLTIMQGLIRKCGMEEFDFSIVSFIHSQEFLGMLPLEPPDVSGWPGYRSWINSITLPVRKVQASSVITGQSPWGNFDVTTNVRALAQSMYDQNEEGYASEQIVKKLGFLFFGNPLSENLEDRMLSVLLDGAEPYDWAINAPLNNPQWDRMRDLMVYIMRVPEFQLS
jgi:hypothetical protein|tara:strand:- start:2060 stop:3718 length:1659 start_codon:yes stop_codon:yes gene_type:complete